MILYLDQNAWIALARAQKAPDAHPEMYVVLAMLVEAAGGGALSVPLSFTNIYETNKINDLERRKHLAWVQCTLSQGRVFRGRGPVLRRQMKAFLAKSYSLPEPPRVPNWFLSDLHFEAVEDYDPATFNVDLSEKFLAFVREQPAFALFDYLTELDDQTRRAAVQKYTIGSQGLIARMKERQALVAGENLDLRRRAYAVRLIVDHIDLLVRTARELGIAIGSWSDLGEERILALPGGVPTFDVELALAIRKEAEGGTVSENDLRDVAAFYTVLPNADIMVAEKPFINRARQAKLGQRYQTTLLTSILELPAHLARLKGIVAGPQAG